jgi:hypothetical protein
MSILNACPGTGEIQGDRSQQVAMRPWHRSAVAQINCAIFAAGARGPIPPANRHPPQPRNPPIGRTVLRLSPLDEATAGRGRSLNAARCRVQRQQVSVPAIRPQLTITRAASSKWHRVKRKFYSVLVSR